MLANKVAITEEDVSELQDGLDKQSKQFRTKEYFEEYAPAWSNPYQHRAQLLFSLVDSYKKHNHSSRWAKCCYTFEKRDLKGSLGHPEDQMVPISRLIREESIETASDLEEFFKRTIPHEQGDELLMPQVNLMHPRVKEEEGQDSFKPCNSPAEVTERQLVHLGAQVDELNGKNCELSKEIGMLRRQVSEQDQEYHELKEKSERQDELIKRLEHRLSQLDQRLQGFGLKLDEVQKENRDLKEADQRRHGDHRWLMNDMRKLLGRSDKATDRLDHLEGSVRRLKRSGRWQEIADSKSPDLKTAEQNLHRQASTGQSLLSQLMKRKPDVK